MNVKINLFKWMSTLLATLVLLVLGNFDANALELGCGTYELTGRYDTKSKIFWLYEGGAAQLPIHLHGTELVTAFLPGEKNYYKIKATVSHKIKDAGGYARLDSVLGVANPNIIGLRYKVLSLASCKN